jgi:hypothetical protein
MDPVTHSLPVNTVGQQAYTPTCSRTFNHAFDDLWRAARQPVFYAGETNWKSLAARGAFITVVPALVLAVVQKVSRIAGSLFKPTDVVPKETIVQYKANLHKLACLRLEAEQALDSLDSFKDRVLIGTPGLRQNKVDLDELAAEERKTMAAIRKAELAKIALENDVVMNSGREATVSVPSDDAGWFSYFEVQWKKAFQEKDLERASANEHHFKRCMELQGWLSGVPERTIQSLFVKATESVKLLKEPYPTTTQEGIARLDVLKKNTLEAIKAFEWAAQSLYVRKTVQDTGFTVDRLSARIIHWHRHLEGKLSMAKEIAEKQAASINNTPEQGGVVPPHIAEAILKHCEQRVEFYTCALELLGPQSEEDRVQEFYDTQMCY